MSAGLGCLLSFALLAIAAIVRPDHATAPRGWWLDTGIRSDGSFRVHRVPIGTDERDTLGIVIDRSIVPEGELAGRIYCHGGAMPTLVDERSVKCR